MISVVGGGNKSRQTTQGGAALRAQLSSAHLETECVGIEPVAQVVGVITHLYLEGFRILGF